MSEPSFLMLVQGKTDELSLKQQPICKLQAKSEWGKGDILLQCYTENTNWYMTKCPQSLTAAHEQANIGDSYLPFCFSCLTA